MADQIVVLEDGQVVEIGRWTDLCEREGGVFREFALAGMTGSP
jgi:ABC-type transport system involved in Fe-S cluster assembly fused permease/ATPase subunit